MSEFDRVMALARQEGLEAGWAKGREEGLGAFRRALIDLIRIRLGSSAVTPAVEQQLETLDSDGLSEAIRKAATAERLEEIFK
jgi:hypothetical protein